jgi:hypothetical protein
MKEHQNEKVNMTALPVLWMAWMVVAVLVKIVSEQFVKYEL